MARFGNTIEGNRGNLPIVTATEAEIDEARVIAAAEKDGIERRAILRALGMSLRTYWRRKALAERLRARRERGEE